MEYYKKNVDKFINNYYNDIIKLKKMKNCKDKDDILNEMILSDYDIELILEKYNIISIKKNTMLFTSQSIINRKENIRPLKIKDFYELNKNPIYPVQSFTKYDDIHISLSSIFLGKHIENNGRLFITKTIKNIKILNIGNKLKDRITFGTFMTKIILGNDYNKHFTKYIDNDIFCYRKSCKKGTLDEKIINFFILNSILQKKIKINGLIRYDSGSDNLCNYKYNGDEILLFNSNENLKLLSIFINNTFYLKIEEYKKYIKNIIKLHNLKLLKNKLINNEYITIPICNTIDFIKNGIQNNINNIINNHFYNI